MKGHKTKNKHFVASQKDKEVCAGCGKQKNVHYVPTIQALFTNKEITTEQHFCSKH